MEPRGHDDFTRRQGGVTFQALWCYTLGVQGCSNLVNKVNKANKHEKKWTNGEQKWTNRHKKTEKH